MRGAKGGGGSGCLNMHCGEWEQSRKELTSDVEASDLVSRVISGDESKPFVDNKEVFKELVLGFSLVVTEFALARFVWELVYSVPNAEVVGELLETRGGQELLFRLIGDVLVETLHFFDLVEFCFINFLFSARRALVSVLYFETFLARFSHF